MGSYGRLLSGDIVKPEPQPVIDAAAWATMEGLHFAARNRMEGENLVLGELLALFPIEC